MSENNPHKIFPAVRYKSVNYLFETATSFKVMMNLLALPTPYLNGSCDMYPHSGHLPEDTYRKPWIRGNVISTCKLFPTDSVIDDLKTNNQQTMNTPESYNDSLPSLQEENDIIPSSIPDSFDDLDLSKAIKNFCESMDPYQETFFEMEIHQKEPQNQENENLYLPEEFIEIDYLKQFKSNLPSLRTKLSRLRTLPVVDPLLNFDSVGVSEGSELRRCEPYTSPPLLHNMDTCLSTVTVEDFAKELINYENLALPDLLEACNYEQKVCLGLSEISDLLMITPEKMDEHHSILKIIQKSNEDIFQVESCEPATQETLHEGSANAVPEEQMKSHIDMEVDLTLSPVPKAYCNSICLSTSALTREPLSPNEKISLVSPKTQRQLEMVLWTAEKHPTYVVGFMLTEPQTNEMPSDFQPLSEAVMFLKSEEQYFFSNKLGLETGDQQLPLCNFADFTESIRSDIVSSQADVEEFNKIILEQDSPTPNIPTPRLVFSNLKRVEEPTLKTSSEHIQLHETQTKSYLQKQNVNFGQAKGSNPSCPQRVGQMFEGKQNYIVHSPKEGQSQPFQPDQPFQKNSLKNVLESQCPSHKDLDHLSNFILLRSQKAPPVRGSLNSVFSPDITRQKHQTELQSRQTQRLQSVYLNAVVSGNASREQSRAVSKSSSPLRSDSNKQHTQLETQDCRVVEVQATESQYHAFYEVHSFAQPYLKFAQKLGLDMKVWGDFRRLTMDQTHFLIKQQEKALSRTKSHHGEILREQEELCHQVTLIHVLVTFKELLLKCGLSPSIEFLKVKNAGDEKRFKQLLKRLEVILFLSQKKQETNPKLLELPRIVTTWFSGRENDRTGKIIVLFTDNSDNTRSIIMNYLHQVKGIIVADLHLDKDQTKLNGASVVSRMCHSECALVCEPHLGPDFPWQSFSLVVEYNHPGPSPWAAVCRERGLIHVSFTTIVPNTDKVPWSLEDSVPYVLFATEGLFNSPMLLQTLESTFNITVLERNYCRTLQMLGGTHQYTVITVDERTAIVIQKQEELCQEHASEGLVMRLTALSLQYSCCWLILHCPDSQGGGLSSEAFSNLILVYSSLVLFGMKSENLDVKVLTVADILEMAKWISQICFYSLISSDSDPVSYMDRGWLTIIQTNEEKCLWHFPCINPLVNQLMLKRAPNLQWLLSASLSELKEKFPEVPHKVLKLFTDTTSLYTETASMKNHESPAVKKSSHQQNNFNNFSWFDGECHQFLSLSPIQDSRIPFAVQDSFCEVASTKDPEPELMLKFSPSSPDAFDSWTSDLWREEKDEAKASNWLNRMRARGRTVQRPDFGHNSASSIQNSKYDNPFRAELTFSNNSVSTNRGLLHDLTSPTKVMKWGRGLSPSPSQTFTRDEDLTRTSARYGSKSLSGQERKRNGDTETLVSRAFSPLKKSKLSYERVPGRSDGQTRLKLF